MIAVEGRRLVAVFGRAALMLDDGAVNNLAVEIDMDFLRRRPRWLAVWPNMTAALHPHV